MAHVARKGCRRLQNVLQIATLWVRGFQTLPIIDVSALVQPNQSPRSKEKVAAQLHAACRDVGFFYVVEHGIPAALSQGVLQQARDWFQLPASVKQQLALRPERCYRGYQALGANVTRYDGGFQRDWHEALDLYREEDPAAVSAAGRPFSPIHGGNQWPSQHPEFERVLRRYIASCLQLGEHLMRGIALGLGVKEDFFEEAGRASASSSYWVTRVIHYPPLAESTSQSSAEAALSPEQPSELDRSVQLSCGEHTDYGLLTLVNQEEHVSALQVRNAAGEWIRADPLPGAFVCNVGDMLKVWTNGLYEPTLHRVVNSDRRRSRVSIPFFYEPGYETLVEPLPQFCRDRPAGFAPVRYGTHLESKVLTNFELEDDADVAVEAK